MPGRHTITGMTLLELLIGMFLSTLLLSGIAGLLGNSVSAYRQQLDLGQIEESGRFATSILASHISQAGYHPEPWQNLTSLEAVTSDSVNRGLQTGDQLGLQRWSSHNCFGNENPVKDANGNPEFHLLKVRFRVTRSNNLAMTCRYGPDASQLVKQVNNYGLVENVESMQVLYAQDSNGDGIADGWARAGSWQHESRVMAIRIALLFRSDRVMRQAEARTITLLDEGITTPADGYLRRVNTLTTAIRGRLR